MGHSSQYRYENVILDPVTADLTPLEQFDMLGGHANRTPPSEAAEAQVPVTDTWM